MSDKGKIYFYGLKLFFPDIYNRRLDRTKETGYMGPRRLIKEGVLNEAQKRAEALRLFVQ